MRRLIVLVAIVVLTGAMLASAALLDVDGGALQGFRFDVDIESPEGEQLPDGEDRRTSNEEETDPSMPSATTTESLDEGSTTTTAPSVATTRTTQVPIETETTLAPQPPDTRAIDLP